MVFFCVLAMLGSQQVRPVIGAVEADSMAAKAGLTAGQEIVAVDGEPTTGWGAVNLQLVRRLGESGIVKLVVRDQDSTTETSRELALDHWLKGSGPLKFFTESSPNNIFLRESRVSRVGGYRSVSVWWSG